MTTKDLNLSLSPDLLQPRQTGNNHSPNIPADNPQMTPRESNKKPESVTTASPWKAAGAIAIMNIAVFLAAGYWLIEHSGKVLSDPAPNATAGAASLKRDFAELNLQLSALQDEIQNLRHSQNAQSDLLDSALKNLQFLEKRTEKTEELPKEKPKAVETLAEDRDWYVNLGSFTSAKEALSLRKKMSAIGYKPQIKKRKEQNQMTHKVVLPGFKNRESAEVAARLLMDQTDLDSLWVWQGSNEG